MSMSADTTGIGVATAEGSVDGCTDSCVGGSSRDGSVDAMASAGGGSSNRIDGCSDDNGFALTDLMPAMTYLVDEVLLLVVDRLEGSDHRGRLFDHGAQHAVHLLCGDGHGDENRGGKGGTWATMASIVGGSGYQAVMVLDWGGHNWGNWKIARRRLRPTASKR
jgi:hypothetical protein